MDKTQTGIAGEFYVLAQLVQRGFVATLTMGNTKGIDILVSNSDLNKLFRVEVKTTDRKPHKESLFGSDAFYSWTMSVKHEQTIDSKLFYCFVALRGTSTLPRFFLYRVYMLHHMFVNNIYIGLGRAKIQLIQLPCEDSESKNLTPLVLKIILMF